MAGRRHHGAALLDFAAEGAYGAAMSSDARSTARHYYAGSGFSLAADMAALAANPQGIVIFLPQLVVLAKPVEHDHPEQWVDLGTSPQGADAWYVHLLAGELAQARQIARRLPAYPWLCFQRGARSAAIHRRSWARFVNRLHPQPQIERNTPYGI